VPGTKKKHVLLKNQKTNKERKRGKGGSLREGEQVNRPRDGCTYKVVQKHDRRALGQERVAVVVLVGHRLLQDGAKRHCCHVRVNPPVAYLATILGQPTHRHGHAKLRNKVHSAKLAKERRRVSGDALDDPASLMPVTAEADSCATTERRSLASSRRERFSGGAGIATGTSAAALLRVACRERVDSRRASAASPKAERPRRVPMPPGVDAAASSSTPTLADVLDRPFLAPSTGADGLARVDRPVAAPGVEPRVCAALTALACSRDWALDLKLLKELALATVLSLAVTPALTVAMGPTLTPALALLLAPNFSPVLFTVTSDVAAVFALDKVPFLVLASAPGLAPGLLGNLSDREALATTAASAPRFNPVGTRPLDDGGLGGNGGRREEPARFTVLALASPPGTAAAPEAEPRLSGTRARVVEWCVVASELATDVGETSKVERPPAGGSDVEREGVVAEHIGSGGVAKGVGATNAPAYDECDGDVDVAAPVVGADKTSATDRADTAATAAATAGAAPFPSVGAPPHFGGSGAAVLAPTPEDSTASCPSRVVAGPVASRTAATAVAGAVISFGAALGTGEAAVLERSPGDAVVLAGPRERSGTTAAALPRAVSDAQLLLPGARGFFAAARATKAARSSAAVLLAAAAAAGTVLKVLSADLSWAAGWSGGSGEGPSGGAIRVTCVGGCEPRATHPAGRWGLPEKRWSGRRGSACCRANSDGVGAILGDARKPDSPERVGR